MRVIESRNTMNAAFGRMGLETARLSIRLPLSDTMSIMRRWSVPIQE